MYLCAIKDVWSRRIVGYSISDRMTSQIAGRPVFERVMTAVGALVLDGREPRTRVVDHILAEVTA